MTQTPPDGFRPEPSDPAAAGMPPVPPVYPLADPAVVGVPPVYPPTYAPGAGIATGYPPPGNQPGSGYPGPVMMPMGGQEPPQKPRTGLIIGIAAGALVVVLAAVAVIYFVVTGSLNRAEPGAPAAASSEVPRAGASVEPSQRADRGEKTAPSVRPAGPDDPTDLASLQSWMEAKYQGYLTQAQDGSLMSRLPLGASPNYAKDFLYSFLDQKSALRFSDSLSLTQVDSKRAELEELERKFLAGEDLDVHIRITRDDGSVYESNGRLDGS